jgi:hypothetical protein
MKAVDIENWDVAGKGKLRLVKLGGSPTDNNAILFRKGQDEVLEQYMEKIEIVADQWVDNWDAANALKPGGKLIFTTLNGLFPLFHSVKEFLASQAKEGNAATGGNSFDLMTFRDHNTTIIEDDLGNKRELHANERYYVPSEITWMLKTLGFTTIDIFGAKLGAFSRDDKLSTEDFEMLVVAARG